MQIATILQPERIYCDLEISSKKRLLESAAGALAQAHTALESAALFDILVQRERLGSTGLGRGVAIPHGRCPDIDHAIGAFLQLHEAVDFDAPDHQGVDLIFTLLVPESCTQEHLRILASLAELFSDQALTARLRAADTADALYAIIREFDARTLKGAAGTG